MKKLLASLAALCTLASCSDQIEVAQQFSPANGGKIAYTEWVPAAPAFNVRIADATDSNRLIFSNAAMLDQAHGRILLLPLDSQGHYPYDLSMCNSDGSGFVQLHCSDSASKFYGEGILSADGQRVAYHVDPQPRTTPVGSLIVARIDGSDKHVITAAEPREVNGAFSKDGRKIAFYYDPTPGIGGGEMIGVANVDGTGFNPVALVEGTAPDGHSTIDWNPDNSRIAYSAGNEVCVVNADGTHRIVIDSGDHPVWSPDGTSLVYTSSTKDLILTRDLGATKQNLTETQVMREDNAQWSLDGRAIVFMASNGDFDPSNNDITIVTLDLTTHERQTLAHNGVFPHYIR